jgi:hypothetical protein
MSKIEHVTDFQGISFNVLDWQPKKLFKLPQGLKRPFLVIAFYDESTYKFTYERLKRIGEQLAQNGARLVLGTWGLYPLEVRKKHERIMPEIAFHSLEDALSYALLCPWPGPYGERLDSNCIFIDFSGTGKESKFVELVLGINDWLPKRKSKPFECKLLGPQYWLGKPEDDVTSHAGIRLTVNGLPMPYAGTAPNMAAVMLLRTVFEEHTALENLQQAILPCGCSLLGGCPHAIDFTVKHHDSRVEIDDFHVYIDPKYKMSGVSVDITLGEYMSEIIPLAREALAFLPEDKPGADWERISYLKWRQTLAELLALTDELSSTDLQNIQEVRRKYHTKFGKRKATWDFRVNSIAWSDRHYFGHRRFMKTLCSMSNLSVSDKLAQEMRFTSEIGYRLQTKPSFKGEELLVMRADEIIGRCRRIADLGPFNKREHEILIWMPGRSTIQVGDELLWPYWHYEYPLAEDDPV